MRFAAILAVLLSSALAAKADTMRMAVTTSFQNSGLSDVLLPQILADTGIQLQLLVVGTGQAIRLGQAGDVDAILVHSRSAEDAFVAGGYGTHRREIMYNDFVLIGPGDDPASVRAAATASEALTLIGRTKSAFISRGDDSGTHKKELALWAATPISQDEFADWYRAVGAGMGAALNIASATGGYVIADRASWMNFANKGDLELLFSGDPALFNQYAFIPVDPRRHAHVRDDLGRIVENWLVSETAEALINGYRIDGENLFKFNATR